MLSSVVVVVVCALLLLCFFFFFQAEDGIRDLIVTGVQTCALPICRARGSRRNPCRGRGRRSRWRSSFGGERAGGGRRAIGQRRGLDPRCGGRSEERRVGKEGRSRWSPYH